jgi:hypothetical protein
VSDQVIRHLFAVLRRQTRQQPFRHGSARERPLILSRVNANVRHRTDSQSLAMHIQGCLGAQVAPPRHPELAQQGRNMDRYSLWADKQCLRDIAVRRTSRDPAEDLSPSADGKRVSDPLLKHPPGISRRETCCLGALLIGHPAGCGAMSSCGRAGLYLRHPTYLWRSS